MAQKLVAKGHKVTMVCGSFNSASTGLGDKFCDGVREGVVEGIHVIEFELGYSNADNFLKRTKTFLSFSMKSLKVVFTESYDLIFATTTPLTAGIPGIFGRWLKGKPFVFEVRDLWPELPREMKVITNPIILMMMSILEWVSYKSANRLIGLSPGIVKGIERHGIEPQKICMIPNGCDLELFNQDITEWSPEGIKDTDLLAVFTGAHGIANGLDAVLDVAAELIERGREDIKFVLIGEGKLKQKLKQDAFERGLSNVIFHDSVSKRKLVGLMKRADAGLQILANVPAFYYGTSPNKFFDYLSSGLPVITNYPGWVADLIEEYKCGYAVPPENAELFADALENAANNRTALKKMGTAASQLAKKSFARDKLSDQFANWLEGQ